MTIPLHHLFRREQWRRWLLEAGPGDPVAAEQLAQRLLDRAVDWGERTGDRGELSHAGADPFEKPAVARRVPPGEAM